MLNKREIGTLMQIQKRCEKIIAKTCNITKEEFEQNDDLIDLLCFNILQIGEMVGGLSDEFIDKYKEIQWRDIRGMRNRIAHGYTTIDVEVVWITCKEDIVTLKDFCQKTLESK